jgi:hypothetical protein
MLAQIKLAIGNFKRSKRFNLSRKVKIYRPPKRTKLNKTQKMYLKIFKEHLITNQIMDSSSSHLQILIIKHLDSKVTRM